MRSVSSSVVALVCLLSAALLRGDVVPVSFPADPTPRMTYGTRANYTVIAAQDFVPLDRATGFTYAGFTTLHRNGGGGEIFVAPLRVPSGAVVETVTAFVTDNNATTNVSVALGFNARRASSGHPAIWGYWSPVVATTGSPGQTIITQTVNFTASSVRPVFTAEPEEVAYAVMVFLPAVDNTNSISGARVQWRLQVAPAPATATFSDVPSSHPFYQFIEALVAAGVTTGCASDPLQYCPDAPITRGQMAVFVSRALGLHWAP